MYIYLNIFLISFFKSDSLTRIYNLMKSIEKTHVKEQINVKKNVWPFYSLSYTLQSVSAFRLFSPLNIVVSC